MRNVIIVVLLGMLLTATGCVANPVISSKHRQMDSKYYYLTQDQFDHYLAHAVQKLKDDGWNIYVPESFDCEDYSFKMLSEIKYAYRQHHGKDLNRGIRVGVVAYVIDDDDVNGDGVINVADGDVNNGGHMCIFVDIYVNGGQSVRKYYQPFPWSKHVPIEMSQAELKSIMFTMM